jgi:hypothetical protein
MNISYEEFNSYSEHDINETFVSACADGDFAKVQYLLNSSSLPYNANIYYDDTACFKLAFHNGHVDIIKYLSCSPDLKEHIDVKPYSYGILNFAKNNKDWEWLEFLLPIIVNDENQHLKNLIGFSCREGDYDTFNYLINSKWKDKIKVDNDLYHDACFGCNVDIIDFLRKNFKNNIDITDDRAFLNCYASLGYESEDLTVMQYFIFDLNIPYSSSIKEYLEEDTLCLENKIKVQKMFEIRELNCDLTAELKTEKLNIIKKNKL